MRAAGLLCLVALPHAACAADAVAKAPRAFFAMDNGLSRTKSLDAKAKLLKELGYSGIGWRPGRTPEMLAALDRHGLRMHSTYVRATAGDGGSYDPRLKDEIKLMRGRGVDIWLYVARGKNADDEKAARVVREVAELAAPAGLRVVLYPHVGFYVDTVDDALRIARKVGRKDVGVSFNLCHFLKRSSEADIPRVLREAAPHLFLVQLNGADAGDTRKMGWNRLIRPLGEGTFDNTKVIRVLDEIGYRGPVALQCYKVRGSDRDHLTRSMEAWRRMTGGTAAPRARTEPARQGEGGAR